MSPVTHSSSPGALAEPAFVLGCALLVMLAMAANVLVLGSMTALFLGAADRAQLPLVYAASALFGGVVTLALGSLPKQLARVVEVSGNFFVLALTLASASVLLPFAEAVLFVAYPIATSLATLAVLQTYAIVNDCLDAEQAKRVLPKVGAGGTLGAMLAGALLAALAPVLGARSMLALAAALALAAGLRVRKFVPRHAPRMLSSAPRGASLRPSDTNALGASPKRILRELWASKLLRRFALGQIALAIASTVLKFELDTTLQATLGTDRIAAFLGMLNLASNAAVLTVQTLFETRLIRRFGLTPGLSSTAFVLSLSGAILLFASGLWVVATLRFAENVTRFSITRTAEDLVLLPVPSELRRRTRAFLATLILPGAVLLASLLLAALTHLPRASAAATMLLTGALAFSCALALRRPYVDRLRDSLRRRRITFETLAQTARDETFAALLDSAFGRDATVRVGALRTLVRHRLQGAGLELRPSDVARELEREARVGHRLRLLQHALERCELPNERKRAAERELAYHVERVDEAIFLLLSLTHPALDMQRAYLAYARGERRERAFALEMLTQALPSAERKLLLPYLNSTSQEDRLREAERALALSRTAVLATLLGDVRHPLPERLRPLGLYLAAIVPANPDEERLMSRLEEVLILRTVDLFSRLSPEELQSVADIATHHELEAEHVVFREGEPGTAFYVVLRGELRVERGGALVAKLGAGECFGELALLDRGLRSATVITSSACTLSRIVDEDFRDLLERYPSIAVHMLAILARRNASMLERT